MTVVTIGAPATGWVLPLSEVPDEVFAAGMMGPGLAIDPLAGMVVAPAAATVTAVAESGHAVTLTLENGADLIIHVGIDTVALKGAGFEPLVAVGDQIAAGAPLIAVDLDRVAQSVPSLVTPLIIASDGFDIEALPAGRAVATGEPLFAVRPTGGVASPAATSEDTARCQVVVPLVHGIHARPAARIAAALKPFSAEVRIERGDRSANARSTVALMGLGVSRGDTILIVSRGDDGRAAATAVATLIESGMDETDVAIGAAVAPAMAPASTPPSSSDVGVLNGVRAAPGLSVGPAYPLVREDVTVEREGQGVAVEVGRLRGALRMVGDRITAEGGAIADAHRAIIDDPEVFAVAEQRIVGGGSAGWAWQDVMREQAEALRSTGDPRLAERAADLRDIERRVLMALSAREPAVPQAPSGAIIVADDILPSEFLHLAAAHVGGLATAGGGPTSHVAILAAAAGLPMLVACGSAILDIAEGTTIILDADAGTIDLSPGGNEIAAARHRVETARATAAAQVRAAAAPCHTRDGTRIEVFANLGSVADAQAAMAAGAEGCGLLRTEFLFLDRAIEPTEAEQGEVYGTIAAALDGRPLIVRTLDIGGDKPVPYLPMPAEDNPALGQRGIRLGFARPDLLEGQLRAIMAHVPGDQCRIMLPMVIEAAEVRHVRAVATRIGAALGMAVPPIGVMVETPAAALLATSIAADADFLSIGSNDLTQYALAADRGNPALAHRVDALHPAVLHLVARACAGAETHGRWIGVCGAIASDPAAAAVLIGLGVRELSVTAAAVPAIKATVRELDLAACRALAGRALAMASADEVRRLVETG